MLLMDATSITIARWCGELEGHGAARLVTPLMRLRDPDYTKIVLVALPETTPVLQAEALQDLRRAQIEPFAWVNNKKHLAADTMTRYCEPD